MFTLKEIEAIRGQQIELQKRKDPLFSECVLQACDSALSAWHRKAPKLPNVTPSAAPVDYWWTRY
jgi:hypothetical protein